MPLKRTPQEKTPKCLKFTAAFAIAVGALVVVMLIVTSISTSRNLSTARFCLEHSESLVNGLVSFNSAQRRISWSFYNLDEDGDPSRILSYLRVISPNGDSLDLCGSILVCKMEDQKDQDNDGESLKPLIKNIRENPHTHLLEWGVANNSSMLLGTAQATYLLTSCGIE